MIFRSTRFLIALVFNLSLICVLHLGVAHSVIAAPQSSTSPAASNTTPQITDNPELDKLLKTAEQTQQSGNFKLAASEWQTVWEKFPDSPLVGTARLQAAVCYQQLKNYPAAIANLKVAIPKLTKQLPRAKLLLGYCQFKLGHQQFITANDAAQKKQASNLLVTAARTFELLLKANPDFPDAFQAAYFLGGVYEELDRKQDAIDAYQQMETLPNPSGLFKYESIFAIADLNFELGQYGQAKQYFDQFLAAPETKRYPDRDAVVYAAAETSIALGEAAKRNGADSESKQHFVDARELLKTIVKPAGSDAQAIALAREAQRLLAFCFSQLGQFQAAADAYATVYQKLDTTESAAIKIQTAIDAGMSYLGAGKDVKGERFLKIATAAKRPESAKAAHLLANFYLKQRRFGDAYKLSTGFIPLAQPPNLVPLKMTQAEAAIEIEGKLKEATTLFQSIATDFPDHELAAAASYNAAFGQVKDDQFESAINTADKFLQRYPENRYLPDVLEVKGNALSLSGQYSAAQKIFQRLVDDPSFTKNPNRSDWILSNAMAKFQQENFAGTISDLQTTTQSITQPGKAVKALYLLGVSHYRLEQYPKATESLTAAVAIDGKSKLADESQFYLGLSLLKQGRFELATQTIDSLAARSPESPFLNEAYVQLGNDRSQAGQQQAAIEWFQKVIDAAKSTSTEKASALHGAAWAHLREEQDLDVAQRLFKQVIDSYPESDLVPTAKAGLDIAQKLAGVDPTPADSPPVDSSLGDSSPVTSPPVKMDPATPIGDVVDTQAIKSLRETGLAQVRDKNWAAAVTTFGKLIKTAPKSALADADLQELAWAYRSLGQEDQALLYFAEIATNKPDSRFATEANYHLGKAAYDEQRYGDAVKFFGDCVGDDAEAKLATGVNATVREKAAYKLAWAYYKQDKFPQAHAAFVRQTELFPTGKLLADGKFMAAESLFRNQQFGQALLAYKVAKPIVDRSNVVEENLKWLTILHGAQAANREQNFQAAIDWTRGVTEITDNESFSTGSFKQDIFLEVGKAYNGIGDSANAIKFWRSAAASLSETGAEATCLVGHQLLKEKNYDDAEREFKKVFFGFGGKEAKPEIRPWQAYARFETARSNFLRAQAASNSQTKQAYQKLAAKHFQALVNDYPNDKLAAKAKSEIERLKLQP